MAKVVTLATQKGGSGKSTLCASLAVAAAEAGEGVVIVDLDPQKSLRRWYDRRTISSPAARVVYRAVVDHGQAVGQHGEERRGEGALSPEEMGNRLADLMARIHTHEPITTVIVDTPGHMSEVADIGMLVADLVLLPVRPGIMDYDPAEETARELAAAGKPYGFILNQVRANRPALVEEAVVELSPHGPIWPDIIGLRADFEDAVVEGLGATEFRPKGQAAEETRRLWSWIAERLRRRAE